MSTWQLIAAAIGVGIFALPMLPAALRFAFEWFDGPAGPVKPLDEVVAPNYRDAIWHLSQVRFRLRATGALSEDQKRAIDILTLALVDGSDK